MSSDFDPHAAGTSRASAAPRPDADFESASSVRAHTFEMVWTAAEGGGDGAWDLPERFELARDLGDGRVGPVFVVRDAARARQAVRFELFGTSRDGDAAERAAREEALRATGRIEHARVAQCLEVGRLGDGRSFVLRPHAEGETLEARLAREGSLHPAAALEITRQLLEALGAVHAAGLLHGALDANSVWLVARAPKSAANPHGIDVRLLDVGVAPHSASQGPELDLHAVGQLLERLLGDGSSSPAAKSALELAASARVPGASVATLLHAVADQLEAQPSARRAAEAGGARGAVLAASPRSAESRAGSAAPLVRYGLIAALAGCGLLGLLGWKLGSELNAAESEAGNERARLSEQLAGAAQERAKLAGELENTRGELRARDEQLGSVQRDAAAEREAAERALAAERERAARELDEARTLLASERERLAQAQAQLRVAAESSDANVRAARGFDATLALLERERGDEALQRARLLESEGLLGARANFVSSLAEAWALLQRFEQRPAGALDTVAAVGEARRALERALAQRADFERESATWLPLEFSSDEPRTRPQRITALVEALGARLANAERQRDELEEREWREIMEAPGLQDPTRAFEHVMRFERPEKLASLAQRFATELRARVVLNGQLDVARLAAFRQLGAWAERLAKGGAGAGASLAPELARDVQLLAHAQRWYDDDPSNDAAVEIARAEFAPVAAAAHSWRAQLVLQARLALPDAAFPLRGGQRALRRSVDPNGRVEWWRESLDGVVDGQWRLRRARFDEQGATALGEGVLRLERQDATWGLAGARSPWLDLRAHGADVQVGVAPLADAPTLPAALAQHAAAARKLESTLRNETCLIYEHGDVRRWYSATLGLVREETRTPNGVAVTELVALEP